MRDVLATIIINVRQFGVTMRGRPWFQVFWRTATWLSFNLGAQAVPILYLWSQRKDDNAAIWEYVNCTLALLVAIGLLIAAISDLITEKCPLRISGVFALIAITGMALVSLHRATHDEFVHHDKPDSELLCGSMIAAAFVVGTGTFLKARIWYTQAKQENKA